MPDESSNRGRGKISWQQASQLIAIAFSIPWTILALTLVGNYLDQQYGTKPWLMLSGLLCGLIAAFFEGSVIVRRMGHHK